MDCTTQKQSFSFEHSVVQFFSEFTFIKENLSSCTKSISWHANTWHVGPSWHFSFSCLTWQDLQVEKLPETFVGVDDF